MVHVRRIVVPIDFSRSSDAAVEYALFLREKLDAQLDLLHVWESPAYTAADTLLLVEGPERQKMTLADYVRSQAERALRGVLEKLAARGIKGVGARLLAGDPYRAIVDASKDYDLVVMGTHGRGAVAHFFLGSVAERVVRRAHVPVLTVRAPEEESAEKEASP